MPAVRYDLAEARRARREAPAPERRRNPRRPVSKPAVIVFRSGHCALGCQILDISDTGAKLRPADILLCPREFILKPQIGAPRDCEVAWRKGGVLGVRFL